MAFGFGFNKQKVLSAAEKFVQQGKLQNAIAEYDKVLKHDSKDLTVNNTIGDLYSRLGDSAKAIECFKMVGDAYAAQGFTVKGIAMYKKITKLQPSVDASLKLAELYTQQGLFNDARAQYLQVAEDFMKNGELDQAVRLFQKVLEMDPENVPMRIKLAEVYVKLGKKKEAWEIFSAAAEALRARGSLPAAEDVLKRMLTLDPSNSYVLLLRGKAALDGDDPKSAVAYLEKASDIDSHPDGLRDLLKAYLQIGPLSKAAPIAEKLLTVHNDPEGLFLLAEGCARLGEYRQAIEVYTRHADRLLATDSSKLLASLHTMITHVRDDSDALDSLLSLLNKAGESTHVNEVTELLAHSSVKDGNLTRARELYRMLATTEPQNQLHMQNYQQVAGRMDGALPAMGITAEEGAVIIEELEATAPLIDQSYPDHVAIALRSAITDADLFLSYNLPEKAVVPLLAALPQAPHDVRLNQRLAALHTRFHRFTEAAVCSRTLESVFHEAGYPDEAVRYGELATRYEHSAEAASLASASAPTTMGEEVFTAAPIDLGLPEAAPEAGMGATAGLSHSDGHSHSHGHAPWPNVARGIHDTAAGHQEFSVQESTGHSSSDAQDLSDFASGFSSDLKSDLKSDSSPDLASEWEQSLSMDEPAPVAEFSSVIDGDADLSSNPEIAETVEEVRFYLEHFMTDQARAGIEKLEGLTSNARILDPLRAAVESAGQPQAEPEPEMAEINADDPTELDLVIGHHDNAEIATSPDLMSSYGHEAHKEIHSVAPAEFASAELAPQEAAVILPHEEPTHADNLSSLVADLEASLGDAFPETHPASSVKPVVEPAHTGSSINWHPARSASATSQPKSEPATHVRIEMPSAPAQAPAIAASATGAATGTAPAMSYAPSSIRPLGAGAQAMHPADSVDLSEMFGELKQELEEDIIAGDDDPETHYNLGVAFREMGLLDEAIAELQKVCTAIDRGKEFTQPVQTYTWLAQCFLDKGVPEAAIRWYEKALTIPGLDAEAHLAINYELGSACEIARDKAAALRHFTTVYGSNIDYRDVAERIQALKS
jgi:tetratricopeptide (TPR) repeat protein